MRSNQALPRVVLPTLLLSLAAGCSLIKVNGKPLGGGSSSASNESSSSSSPPSSSAPAPAGDTASDDPYKRCKGFDVDRRDCEDRVNAELRQKRAAAMSKQPTWCKDYHLTASGNVDLEKFKNITDPKRNIYADAYAFADVMCSVDGRNLEQRPKVMEIRTAWMKHNSLDETDFLAAVSVQSRYVPSDQPLSALGPAIAQMDSGFTANKLDELGARTSMMGRIAYVERCMEPASAPAIGKILCAREPLDLAKALAEIDAAPQILPHMRLRLRSTARRVIVEQRQLNAALVELAKSEPAVTKLIAIADAQHKEWTNPTPARAKAVKLVEELEAAKAANKNSGFAGCEEKTRAAWTEAVRAARFPALSSEYTLRAVSAAIFTTTEAFLARRAYELCMAGTDHGGAIPYDVMGGLAYRRGPRSSTLASWVAASAEIKFDSRDLSMADAVKGSVKGEPWAEKYGAVGTIAKLTPTGRGSVAISFKTDVDVREDCISWKNTGRISNVTAGGAVEYESVCTKRGMVKYDKSPDDITVDATFAAGLKPGMYLLMDRNSSRMAGAPIAATAGPKSSKAVWVIGVALE